ncbi:MAG: phosphatase PAP2 family protein [Erysipelotrichaceae bacterium]|nr:phosphatase PAP2 family protein [Erysipelotrichaceae bacterium]
MTAFELQILDLIQKYMASPLMNTVMVFITSLGDYGILWIIITGILLFNSKTRKEGIASAISLILCAIICNGILKPLVGRIRPCDLNTAVTLLVNRPPDYSFPSGHTASSFASAVAIFASGNKKLGIVSIVIAFLIGFSRMYVYVHFPTDVLAGMMLGIMLGVIGKILTDHTSTKNT